MDTPWKRSPEGTPAFRSLGRLPPFMPLYGCKIVTSTVDFFFLDVLLLIKKRVPAPLPKMADVSAEEKVSFRVWKWISL